MVVESLCLPSSDTCMCFLSSLEKSPRSFSISAALGTSSLSLLNNLICISSAHHLMTITIIMIMMIIMIITSRHPETKYSLDTCYHPPATTLSSSSSPSSYSYQVPHCPDNPVDSARLDPLAVWVLRRTTRPRHPTAAPPSSSNSSAVDLK